MVIRPSKLNDVDVIYFDPSLAIKEDEVSEQLNTLSPHVNWEVKNQARMHLKHGDLPYRNTADAMSHWPEKETAVGVRLISEVQLEYIAPFGLQGLFEGYISHNPRRSKSVFEQRIRSKNWLKTWPKLKVR